MQSPNCRQDQRDYRYAYIGHLQLSPIVHPTVILGKAAYPAPPTRVLTELFGEEALAAQFDGCFTMLRRQQKRFADRNEAAMQNDARGQFQPRLLTRVKTRD